MRVLGWLLLLIGLPIPLGYAAILFGWEPSWPSEGWQYLLVMYGFFPSIVLIAGATIALTISYYRGRARFG